MSIFLEVRLHDVQTMIAIEVEAQSRPNRGWALSGPMRPYDQAPFGGFFWNIGVTPGPPKYIKKCLSPFKLSPNGFYFVYFLASRQGTAASGTAGLACRQAQPGGFGGWRLARGGSGLSNSQIWEFPKVKGPNKEPK